MKRHTLELYSALIALVMICSTAGYGQGALRPVFKAVTADTMYGHVVSVGAPNGSRRAIWQTGNGAAGLGAIALKNPYNSTIGFYMNWGAGTELPGVPEYSELMLTGRSVTQNRINSNSEQFWLITNGGLFRFFSSSSRPAVLVADSSLTTVVETGRLRVTNKSNLGNRFDDVDSTLAVDGNAMIHGNAWADGNIHGDSIYVRNARIGPYGQFVADTVRTVSGLTGAYASSGFKRNVEVGYYRVNLLLECTNGTGTDQYTASVNYTDGGVSRTFALKDTLSTNTQFSMIQQQFFLHCDAASNINVATTNITGSSSGTYKIEAVIERLHQ